MDSLVKIEDELFRHAWVDQGQTGVDEPDLRRKVPPIRQLSRLLRYPGPIFTQRLGGCSQVVTAFGCVITAVESAGKLRYRQQSRDGALATRFMAGSMTQQWGVGVTQAIDAAAMNLYLGYINTSTDITVQNTTTGVKARSAPLDSMDLFYTGATIKF